MIRQARPTLRNSTRAGLCLTVVLSLLISGCGFQLRGTSTVPEAIQPLAVVCESPVPERLCDAVSDQLRLGDVETAPRKQATSVLTLNDFQQQRRANAITARAAAAEYTLRQSVFINVASGNGTPLVARERITAAETYRYDETNVLAKQQEEDELQLRLSERLAQQILFRLTPLNQTRIDSAEAAP